VGGVWLPCRRWTHKRSQFLINAIQIWSLLIRWSSCPSSPFQSTSKIFFSFCFEMTKTFYSQGE
jgi:hypothetical protein